MKVDTGELLRLEWEKHHDWKKLGDFVAQLQVSSFRAGFESGKFTKTSALKQAHALLDKLVAETQVQS